MLFVGSLQRLLLDIALILVQDIRFMLLIISTHYHKSFVYHVGTGYAILMSENYFNLLRWRCKMKNNSMTVLRQRWESNTWGLLNIGLYMSDADRTKAFDGEAEKYCSQNGQNCKTCSLVNYGMDCHNNLVG